MRYEKVRTAMISEPEDKRVGASSDIEELVIV